MKRCFSHVFMLMFCLGVKAQFYDPTFFNPFQSVNFDMEALSKQAIEQSRMIQEAGNNKIVLSCVNNSKVEFAYLQAVYLDDLLGEGQESYTLLSIKFKDAALCSYRLYNNATRTDLVNNTSLIFKGKSKSGNIRMSPQSVDGNAGIEVAVLDYDNSSESVLYRKSAGSNCYKFKLVSVVEGFNNSSIQNGYGNNGSCSGRNKNSVQYDLNSAEKLLNDLKRQKASCNSAVLEQQYNRMIIEQENKVRELRREYNNASY